MSQRPTVIYRAQPRCSECPWIGERQGGTKREPAGSLAHADAIQHAQHTNHRVDVNAGWRGRCRGCGVISDSFQRVQQAWGWIEEHTTNDPKHQRRQREQQERAALADRIAKVIEES